MPKMPFRVAIATTLDPMVALPKLTALCKVLGELVERPASGHLMVSYEELELSAEADGFEMMWLPPLIALNLVPHEKADAMAVPVREGETSYATAFFTKPGVGVKELASLEGKRVAWVDQHSCAGYVLPRALLKRRGLDPDRIFEQQGMLGSHAKVVAEVLDGEADVGATFVHLDDGAIVSAAWGERDVEVIESYGPIPADILAFGRKVRSAVRDLVTEALMDDDSPLAECARDLMECEGFAAPDADHLAALSDLVGDDET
jgi:phosphonate transport system substrate-binding protein